MNYCTINLGDLKIGLKFGLASFRYLSECKLVEGKTINNGELNEIGIAHIIYSGYFNNCLVKDVEVEHDFSFFCDLIEQNITDEKFIGTVKDALKVWSENDFIRKASGENVEEGKKKGGKKSKPLLSDS